MPLVPHGTLFQFNSDFRKDMVDSYVQFQSHIMLTASHDALAMSLPSSHQDPGLSSRYQESIYNGVAIEEAAAGH